MWRCRAAWPYCHEQDDSSACLCSASSLYAQGIHHVAQFPYDWGCSAARDKRVFGGLAYILPAIVTPTSPTLSGLTNKPRAEEAPRCALHPVAPVLPPRTRG